jgi:hypothetical protein
MSCPLPALIGHSTSHRHDTWNLLQKGVLRLVSKRLELKRRLTARAGRIGACLLSWAGGPVGCDPNRVGGPAEGRGTPINAAFSETGDCSSMADDKDDDHANAMVDAFLQHTQMDETQRYLSRGRQFETTSEVELKLRRVEAFRRWCKSHSPGNVRKLDDLSAELRMRGVEPSEDSVKEELSMMREEIQHEYESDPEWQEEIAKRKPNFEKRWTSLRTKPARKSPLMRVPVQRCRRCE